MRRQGPEPSGDIDILKQQGFKTSVRAWLPSEIAPRSDAFLAGYLGPILLSTALVVGLLLWLHRHRSSLPGTLPRCR